VAAGKCRFLVSEIQIVDAARFTGAHSRMAGSILLTANVVITNFSIQ